MSERTPTPDRLVKYLANSPSLLPQDLSDQRSAILVVDSLIVKHSLPVPDSTHSFIGPGCEAAIFNPQNILAEFSVGSEDPLDLVIKNKPHGTFDLMLIQSACEVRPGICDLDSSARHLCYALFCVFSEYAKNAELYPYIAFSYDPDTEDRETGQSIKRFHAHLIGRTPQELSFIQDHTRPLGKLGQVQSRRIVDETTIIGSHILCDQLQNTSLSTLEMHRPFSVELPSAPTAMFRLKSGWPTLITPEFSQDFQVLHANIVSGYKHVMDCIWQGKSGEWSRPSVYPLDQILANLGKVPSLTGSTREMLNFALSRIQPSLLSKTDILSQPKYRDLATFLYPLAGPCYSTSIAEIKGSVWLSLRPFMFSDMGGAGIGNPLGITTKIDRSPEFFTPAEQAQRTAFQTGFARLVS